MLKVEESSELALWAAVLEQAIADLDVLEERTKAISWFTSDRMGFGSFYFVADMLDQHPEKLRQRIFHYRRQQVELLQGALCFEEDKGL